MLNDSINKYFTTCFTLELIGKMQPTGAQNEVILAKSACT